MLVLNMSIFNFTDGWSRTFSKHECARSWAWQFAFGRRGDLRRDKQQRM